MATTPEPLPANGHTSHRLPGYDYSLAGAYFITMCTQNRECSLASIDNGCLALTHSGEIVHDVWLSLPDRFPFVSLDLFVTMPNHVHGILLITDPSPRGRENAPKSLGWVVRTFKAASTRRIRRELPGFAWQRDYYDHVVRSDGELQRIREYIEANPARWNEDPENVAISTSAARQDEEPW